MPVTLGKNIASLRGIRQLEKATNRLDSIFQRLASGQRINRASDDAAGLTVSSSLNADARILIQGTRNLNGDQVPDVISQHASSPDIGIYFAQTEEVAGLVNFSLASANSARTALERMNTVRTELNQSRGTIGAFQSRIATAINVNEVAVVNYRSAESRIQDVDVAEAAAELNRMTILQQAASSILAQANQQPALALQLLT